MQVKTKTLSPNTLQGKVIIGYFDVIHKGHLRLFAHQPSSIITFDLIPHKQNPLNSLAARVQNLAAYGFKEIYVLSPEQMNSAADQFVSEYLLKTQQIIVGSDFKFGKDFKSIKDFTPPLNVLEITYDNNYSTTKIKALLAQGEVTTVNQMLPHDFKISHIVEHGNKLGRELGFPTVNFNYEHGSFLGSGIYYTSCIVNNEIYRSVTTSMKQKKVASKTFDVIETYILDFNQDLYGQKIEVVFHNKIGQLEKFDSFDKLKQHIHRIVEEVKNYDLTKDPITS